MNWFLALAVVAIVLVGACAVTVGMGINTGVDTFDYAVRGTCYEAGWSDGSSGVPYLAAQLEEEGLLDDPECSRGYSDGLRDERSGNYDPPENP